MQLSTKVMLLIATLIVATVLSVFFVPLKTIGNILMVLGGIVCWFAIWESYRTLPPVPNSEGIIRIVEKMTRKHGRNYEHPRNP